MNRSSFRIASFFLLSLTLNTVAGAAQENSGGAVPPDPDANVVLGGGTGEPGQQVVLPIYLRPPGDAPVGSLKLEVTFVSVNLKFQKIEPGIAADMGNVDIKSEAKTGKNDKGVETTTVTVNATAPSGGSDQKGIPPGLLAYIALQISETGRPATIGLQTRLEATEFGTKKKLNDMRVADSAVEVVAAGTQPEVACFFFTH